MASAGASAGPGGGQWTCRSAGDGERLFGFLWEVATATQACEYAENQCTVHVKRADRVACGASLRETHEKDRTGKERQSERKERKTGGGVTSKVRVRVPHSILFFRLRVVSTSPQPGDLSHVTRPARGGPGPVSASPIPHHGRRPPRQPCGVTQAQRARATKQPAGFALGGQPGPPSGAGGGRASRSGCLCKQHS